jgi:hypothetical protein
MISEGGAISKEPAITLETNETLRCTPQGQVATLHSRTVISFTNEAARELRTRRPIRGGG